MGDRASIAFSNGTEESVALFSHWGGMNFVKAAKRYARNLQRAISQSEEQQNARQGVPLKVYPLGRLEPATVMVDFISQVTNGQRISSNLYLGKDGNDGDNSDNGHHIIDLSKDWREYHDSEE